ncbi:Nuclear factor related to kappa-B-binding protein [Melia azedarach]|uniref:Nuclear factor related to kappa-B-binding protein n=1 Tax=Melia azedarach TaxID=155640 RepID=A0ACC1X293_MELAZ|nr:Nuclear factor related to kappa-B-binding protein [Melia azedarach]
MGKVKNAGSDISPMEMWPSQYHARKHKRKTISNQSASSEMDPSYNDQVVQDNKFGVAYGARTGRVREEAGVELSNCLDAALALMKLANDSSGLLKNQLHLNANQMPVSLVVIDELNDKITNSNHSQVAGYKTNLLEKLQQSTSDVNEDETGQLLKKAKKFGNSPLLLPSKYKGRQHLIKDRDPLGMSMMTSFKCKRVKKKEKKKTEEPYKSESGVVEYNGLDEPPISSFKKHGLKKGRTDASSSEADALSFSKNCGKDNSNITQTKKINLPSLTIHEIVERVRRNPVDPSVLEVQEPLEDLVRGALNIFSSKLGPSGAKGWEALTLYLRSTKTWSWTGPVSFKPYEAIQEQVSAEVWGLPCRMLTKLVDSFASWFRSVEKTLQQIKSLPAPPMTLMQKTAHLEERLRGARPRKCIATISPCSAQLRAYFHKEEALRYSVPERAFSYTAVDGRKSTVAPMRRSSGKPSSKVRDHFMLKADRPPHVTVLCLVRDAAARLPESMGTRADVCTLMRDSQYIVEDVSDDQLNQVVSRALDRLHYENDPCVQFDGDKKLWVYLHGDREEDDFQEDGTVHKRSCRWRWQ